MIKTTTFTNHLTWAIGSSFQVSKNLREFLGIVVNIRFYGMKMGKPFSNIMGFIIGSRNDDGFTTRGSGLITGGELTISRVVG